jgi:hypothetical protein
MDNSPTPLEADETHKKADRRRKKRRVVISALGLLGLALLVDYFAYPYGSAGGQSINRGENGLWLRYTWYFGRKTDAEVSDLARKLQQRQIQYAYFHVRSITKEGSLKYRYPEQARRLVRALRRDAPYVKLLAWIYAGNAQGEGEVDLTNTPVRARMVEEAVWLVRQCGFDGVQWDYEICQDNDAGFLALMRETRAALPQGTLLATATPLWLPWPLGRFGWSKEYYAKVASTCDQICVMCYDSGFWLPRSYAWLAHQQVVQVSEAVAQGKPSCRLLLGVPTYGKGFLSHNPHAENIRIALKGVRDGVSDPRTRKEVFAGVALFADYTTDEVEWYTYEEMWLQR